MEQYVNLDRLDYPYCFFGHFIKPIGKIKGEKSTKSQRECKSPFMMTYYPEQELRNSLNFSIYKTYMN